MPEKIVFRARPHRISYCVPTALPADAGGVVGQRGLRSATGAAAVALAAIPHLRHLTTEYVVTNRRLCMRAGVLRVTTLERSSADRRDPVNRRCRRIFDTNRRPQGDGRRGGVMPAIARPIVPTRSTALASDGPRRSSGPGKLASSVNGIKFPGDSVCAGVLLRSGRSCWPGALAQARRKVEFGPRSWQAPPRCSSAAKGHRAVGASYPGLHDAAVEIELIAYLVPDSQASSRFPSMTGSPGSRRAACSSTTCRHPTYPSRKSSSLTKARPLPYHPRPSARSTGSAPTRRRLTSARLDARRGTPARHAGRGPGRHGAAGRRDRLDCTGLGGHAAELPPRRDGRFRHGSRTATARSCRAHAPGPAGLAIVARQGDYGEYARRSGAWARRSRRPAADLGVSSMHSTAGARMSRRTGRSTCMDARGGPTAAHGWLRRPRRRSLTRSRASATSRTPRIAASLAALAGQAGAEDDARSSPVRSAPPRGWAPIASARRTPPRHPAARTFQALRIVVNAERESLSRLLGDLPALCERRPGGF